MCRGKEPPKLPVVQAEKWENSSRWFLSGSWGGVQVEGNLTLWLCLHAPGDKDIARVRASRTACYFSWAKVLVLLDWVVSLLSEYEDEYEG